MKFVGAVTSTMVCIVAFACTQVSAAALPRLGEPQPHATSNPVEGPVAIPTMEISSVQLPPAVIDGHGLTPAMNAAVAKMKKAAEAGGFEVEITDGYITPAEQDRRYAKAVQKFGPDTSKAKPAWQSAHVRGEAIDVAPQWVAEWVFARQDEFGLCRTSTTDLDHFEVKDPMKPCPEPTEGGEDG